MLIQLSLISFGNRLLSSCRDNPIHLWDAYSGQLVATYRAYNQVDEVVAANCVAFDAAGAKIYSGYDKTVRIFDVTQPGRHCQSFSTHSKGNKT